MTGNCTIDSTDVYSSFRAYIPAGGYNELLLLPAMKKPEANDWPDEDGLDVDLSAPRLEAREVQIPFVLNGEPGNFVDFLAKPGMRHFEIPSVACVADLRYLSVTSCKLHGGLSAVAVQLAEDSVQRSQASYAPGVNVPATGYILDGVPVERFGLIMQGREELLKPAPAKQNMGYTTAAMNGKRYDSGMMRRSGKEVTFNCRLKAVSAAAFQNCRKALLYALTAPGPRRIKRGTVEYTGYYKNTGGGKLRNLHGEITFDFNISFLIY